MNLRICLCLVLIVYTESCKKAAVEQRAAEVKRFGDDVDSEEANSTNNGDDYDYDDVTATIDENPDDEDDSSDAFQDVEDEELCRYYSDAPQSQKLPGAVIIGTKKGGTRALLEFLNIHSKIKRAKNEIHFYDKNYSHGVNWYIDQMPPVADGQIAMEKTPGYFHTPGVARRMWIVNNKTKLIMIVRHPVTRLISDYNQFRSNNIARGEEYPDLESLVTTENGDVDPSYPPVKRSQYHIHMSRWLEIFPANQIHVVDGDKFIKTPWEEIKSLETFLDLEPELTKDNFYFNSSKGFYCGRQEVKREDSEWGCARTKCLSPSKGRPKPPVAPSLVSTLTKFFIPHNEKFFSLIGKHFDWNTIP